MEAKKKLRSHCPINFALESIGDRWALLIIRDIMFRGKKSYAEFLESEEKIATNILSARLKKLVADGILQKKSNPKDARSDYYLLTEKGVDLVPLVFQMMLWSGKYDPKSETKRIKGFMGLVQNNFFELTKDIKDRLKRGEPIFPEYLF